MTIQVPLFLSAPGLGEGQLAYLQLIEVLGAGDQPVYTLENSEELSYNDTVRVNTTLLFVMQTQLNVAICEYNYPSSSCY